LVSLKGFDTRPEVMEKILSARRQELKKAYRRGFKQGFKQGKGWQMVDELEKKIKEA